jgi:hypothetical protein
MRGTNWRIASPQKIILRRGYSMLHKNWKVTFQTFPLGQICHPPVHPEIVFCLWRLGQRRLQMLGWTKARTSAK